MKNNIIIILLTFSPLVVLGQNHIWNKTQNEVNELIKGDWKRTSWKFEGSEKPQKDEVFAQSIYIKNDSLKLTELIIKNNTKEILESDINTTIEKYDSGFFLCVDYGYKIFCWQIMFIDKSKLILEEGPNIYTYEKLTE